MENYPKPVTKENHEIILDYLDNSIYKIKGYKEKYGIGFFCSLNCHNKKVSLLITNYQIINENYLKNYDYIDVLINQKLIRVDFNLLYYLDKNLDLSIIEINENEKIKILELDDDIYKEESEMYFNKESIYIINGNSVSYSLINNITKSELIFNCNLSNNSFCYPIFNLKTNKLIGIYKKDFIYYHNGIFFKYIIELLETKYKKKDLADDYNNLNNEIEISIHIDYGDIKNKIYFLDNEYIEDDIKKSSLDNLKELNELNTELYIKKGNEEKKEKYKKYFIPEEEGIYNIKLKFNNKLTNCSYMFAGCDKIININFCLFNTKYIKNMRYMFYGCKNLISINLYSFNTINCKDMSHMFEKCEKLKYLDLSSFKINKVVNMNHMFLDCFKLKEEFFKRLDFKQLKQLDLSNNYISDIKELEKVDFKQLQQLDLSHNIISDIKELQRVNFKLLKKLNLSCNNILDIQVLERVDFKQLQQLDLSDNNKQNNKGFGRMAIAEGFGLTDIQVLERVNFKQLQRLDLSNNQILEIQVLEKVNFKQLQRLD